MYREARGFRDPGRSNQENKAANNSLYEVCIELIGLKRGAYAGVIRSMYRAIKNEAKDTYQKCDGQENNRGFHCIGLLSDFLYTLSRLVSRFKTNKSIRLPFDKFLFNQLLAMTELFGAPLWLTSS
jgi:hypothetical protein